MKHYILCTHNMTDEGTVIFSSFSGKSVCHLFEPVTKCRVSSLNTFLIMSEMCPKHHLSKTVRYQMLHQTSGQINKLLYFIFDQIVPDLNVYFSNYGLFYLNL